MKKIKIFYRHRYEIDPFSGIMDIVRYEYVVHKETPGGYWILPKFSLELIDPNNHRRLYLKRFGAKWISKKPARNSFALESIEDSLKDFIIKRERQKQHLEQSIIDNNHALEIAKRILNDKY